MKLIRFWERGYMKLNVVYNEDCKITMQQMPAESIEFCITDPPYLLEFMGKEFDKQHKNMDGENDGQRMQKWHEEWVKEAYRILKPGGYLVTFAGSRTFHRLASAMEDVGFEIRDVIFWAYGSGFPKSLNISKTIDRYKGAEREIVGTGADYGHEKGDKGYGFKEEYHITKPATPEAEKWDGWGTALKPAYEPIVIGMKKLDRNFVNNALVHGVAGINIDASRVGTSGGVEKVNIEKDSASHDGKGFGCDGELNELDKGRWPANVILTHHPDCECIGTKKIKGGKGNDKIQDTSERSSFNKSIKGIRRVGHADENGMEIIEEWNCHDDCPIKIMDEQSGNVGGKWGKQGDTIKGSDAKKGEKYIGDHGGASRFFYTAKPSSTERNAGLGNQENIHPTKKPVDLMRYLVQMFSTPDGGVVYDPFSGSGATLIACKILDRPYIGSEMDPEYYEICKQRLTFDWKNWWNDDKPKDVKHYIEEYVKRRNEFF